MKLSLKKAAFAGSLLTMAMAAFADHYLMKPGRFDAPVLHGTLSRHSLRHDGRARRYAMYLPAELPRGAPLILALHGAGSDGLGMRLLTGQRLDHLADRHGMAVVYPEGEHRRWNDCRRDGDGGPAYPAQDDVGFLRALRDELAARHGIDPARVHAVGFSDGGQMGLRLALQAPDMLASLSIIAAGMPAPEHSRCGPRPNHANAPPVLMVNGTRDRLTPYAGGATGARSGSAIALMSSRDTAAWLAGSGASPETTRLPANAGDGCRIERTRWRNGARQVALYTIHGGGHTWPQPYVRYPRRLGHTHAGFDGIAVVEDFVLSGHKPDRKPQAGRCPRC